MQTRAFTIDKLIEKVIGKKVNDEAYQKIERYLLVNFTLREFSDIIEIYNNPVYERFVASIPKLEEYVKKGGE